ncbi:MAG: hypothetical protein HGA71_10745 [Azonexaceae bacterium]|nr:hypothetical protein [Azonexaceae bacterium]
MPSESPRTGIILLVLVAVTTASGGFLGWTSRGQAAPVQVVRLAPAANEGSIVPPVAEPMSVIPATTAPASPAGEQASAVGR